MTPRVLSISAVTLATQDMTRAVRFYRALGFVQAYGGETATFTSFRVGEGHINLIRNGECLLPALRDRRQFMRRSGIGTVDKGHNGEQCNSDDRKTILT